MSTTVLVLNGPNLNLIGTREPAVYGNETIQDIEDACVAKASKVGVKIDFRQSNHEGILIDWIQEATSHSAGIVINPGAYTHTSIAIMDAISSIDIPVIEVHISNVYNREAFRHTSYVSKVASGVLAGFGTYGYILALDAMTRLITSES